jgi:hypothetical protein
MEAGIGRILLEGERIKLTLRGHPDYNHEEPFTGVFDFPAGAFRKKRVGLHMIE